MIQDTLASFLPIGSNLSFASASTGQTVYSNVVDILGLGVGNAPQNNIGISATIFGTDMGIGGMRPQTNVVIGTAAVTGNSATLNVQFQGSPDTASTYAAAGYQTLMETGPLTAAQLAASGVAYTGVIARFDWPASVPAQTLNRYYRLAFVTLVATNFTAGTIASAVITTVRDDLAQRYAQSNYIV